MSSFSTTTLLALLGASTAFAQYPTAPAGDACATACIAAFRTCQSDLSNTRAQCASELSSCVGYVPFDNSGSFVTPTACSSTASATATAYSSAAPTYGASGDACATNCVAAFRTCQSDLSNTRAQCASDLASCVGYNPFDNSGSFVTPTACSSTASATATATASASKAPGYGGGADACAANCVAAFRTCQSNTANTRAQCASDLSSCVGYVPFDNSGSFVTPTACSATASATATASASTSSAPKPTGDCAANCVAAFRTCQSDTSNNRSLCASNLASCVGYNPFDNSGSFVTPTACSSTSAGPTQSKATGTAPAPTTYGASSSVGIPASKTANATVSTPAVYTGAAALFNAGGPLAAMAAGAVALLV